MSARRKFIIYLDALLLLVFLLLLSPRMTGLALHEILGIILFIPILFHLLFAWPWIQNIIKHFLKKERRRARINFFLNITLFVLVIVEIVSGLTISQITLPFIGIKTINDRTWRALHNQTLNFTMLFVGLHLAINWDWIISVFKKRIQVATQKHLNFLPGFFTILFRVFIIIIAASTITGILYFIFGQPSLNRIYVQDEIARFRPTLGHGIGQFLGETFLIALIVYIARKWLRVRL